MPQSRLCSPPLHIFPDTFSYTLWVLPCLVLNRKAWQGKLQKPESWADMGSKAEAAPGSILNPEQKFNFPKAPQFHFFTFQAGAWGHISKGLRKQWIPINTGCYYDYQRFRNGM